MSRTNLLLVAIISFVTVGAGCRSDMQDQPRYKPYKESAFFADRRASRDFEAGTVARGHLKTDRALHTGIETGDAPVTDENQIIQNAVREFPIAVDEALLNRGEERYKVFCGVCHGPLGDGDGMIVKRGFVKPGDQPLPKFTDKRLVDAPVGHLFYVISNGKGRMYPYAHAIPVKDRWAIVSYIKTLQKVQTTAEAPASMAQNSGGGAN